MTTNAKNFLVGICVLTGLAMLAWMILEFGGVLARPFVGPQNSVTVAAERADGISAGSPVLFRGVNVGQVVDVTVAEDLSGVIMHARLSATARVPANVQGVIRPQTLISGNNALSLELTGPPKGVLADGAQLTAEMGSVNLLPKEFTSLAEELRLTSKQFRESGVVAHLDQTLGQATRQLAKAGEVMDSVQKLTSDPAMKKNLLDSIANVRDVTDSAKRIAADVQKFTGSLDGISSETAGALRQAKTSIAATEKNINELSRQVGDRLMQVSDILDAFHSISQKIDKGQGSAGLLVNDPKLYEAMVDSAKQMNLVMSDLKRLVEQWEQEGVGLKLK
jgi:phospholipid/cholesterol/gamma-HCH transport system substrate-binding protein